MHGRRPEELLTPALLAILSPLVIGFLFGLEALAGFLAGVILVGQLLAVFMANAGGAWIMPRRLLRMGCMAEKALKLIRQALSVIPWATRSRIQRGRL